MPKSFSSCRLSSRYAYVFASLQHFKKDDMDRTYSTQWREQLVGNTGGKRTLYRPNRRWEDNTKSDLQEIWFQCVMWSDLIPPAANGCL